MMQRADEKDKLLLLIDELERSNGVVLLQRFQFAEDQEIAYESRKIVSRFFDADELSQLVV